MSAAPRIWHQSRRGRVIDMVEPRADQVDFAEIADQLADLNRYAGAAERAVSVANHTLIADRVAVLSGATPRQRALVLLHDLHVTRIGETPTSSSQAKVAIATQMFGLPAGDMLRQVLDEEKRRHDIAIHEAAGIAMPVPCEKAFIHHCDIVALATERRDFLGSPPMPWAAAVEQAVPLRHRQKLLPPAEATLALHQLFIEFLPGAALQSERTPRRTRRFA